MVNRMLMKKSALQPLSRKTPRGGRMMARMILQISLDTAISNRVVQRIHERMAQACGTYDAVKAIVTAVVCI